MSAPPRPPTIGPRPSGLWRRALGLAASAIVLGVSIVAAWVIFAPEALSRPDGTLDGPVVAWAAVLASAVAFGLGGAIVAARALFGPLGGGPGKP